MLGSIGIVYGDIGTSPLYTMKESFLGPHPLAVDPLHIFGVLSLIFWTLMLIVTFKYVAVAMRADNRGEGGSFALLSLIARNLQGKKLDVEAGPAWRARHVPFLWRRDDHAGDLGPFSGGGTDNRPGAASAARHPDRDRDPCRSVPGPGAGYGEGRHNVRAGDALLFRRARGPRHRQYHRPSGNRRHRQPDWAVQFFAYNPNSHSSRSARSSSR